VTRQRYAPPDLLLERLSSCEQRRDATFAGFLGRRVPQQPLVAVRSWPAPDVRERQLFGVSMRTAGFRRGDRKVRDPQSTHRGRSTVSSETWKRTYAVDHSSASNATLVGDRYPVPSVRSCAARMLAKDDARSRIVRAFATTPSRQFRRRLARIADIHGQSLGSTSERD